MLDISVSIARRLLPSAFAAGGASNFHRALSSKPNSAYALGKDGTILFRAHWANDTKALAAGLDAIAAGNPPRRSQSGGVVQLALQAVPYLAPVLDRAGGGAWGDKWRVAPHGGHGLCPQGSSYPSEEARRPGSLRLRSQTWTKG